MSLLMPTSSAMTSRTCPSESSLMAWEVLTIGIGQYSPTQSIVRSDSISHLRPGARPLYEQIYLRVRGDAQVGGGSGDLLHLVDEVISAQAHKRHRRCAGDEPHALLLGEGYHLLERRHPITIQAFRARLTGVYRALADRPLHLTSMPPGFPLSGDSCPVFS